MHHRRGRLVVGTRFPYRFPSGHALVMALCPIKYHRTIVLTSIQRTRTYFFAGRPTDRIEMQVRLPRDRGSSVVVSIFLSSSVHDDRLKAGMSPIQNVGDSLHPRFACLHTCVFKVRLNTECMVLPFVRLSIDSTAVEIAPNTC